MLPSPESLNVRAAPTTINTALTEATAIPKKPLTAVNCSMPADTGASGLSGVPRACTSVNVTVPAAASPAPVANNPTPTGPRDAVVLAAAAAAGSTGGVAVADDVDTGWASRAAARINGDMRWL